MLSIAVFNGLLAALSLVTSAMAARLLGPEGRGELAQAQVVPSLIGTFAMIGLSEAVVFHASKEPNRASVWIATGTVAGLLSTTAAWGLFVVFILVVPVDNRQLMLTYAPMIILMAGYNIPHSSLRAVHRFAVWNYLRLGPPAVWLVALGAGYALNKPDVPFLIVVQLVLLAVFGIVLFAVVMRAVPGKYRVERGLLRPLLAFGVAVLTAQLPQVLALRLDQVVVTALLPQERIGHYFVALGWSAIPTLFLQAIGAVVFPRVASMTNLDAQRNSISRVSRLSVWLALSITVGVIACTPLAIPVIFGEAFRESSWMAMILAVAAAARGVAGVLQESARGLGKVGLILRSELAGLGVLAICIWPLTTTLSVYGVASATLLSAATAMLVILVGLAREVDLPVKSMLALRKDDVAALWKQLSRKWRSAST